MESLLLRSISAQIANWKGPILLVDSHHRLLCYNKEAEKLLRTELSEFLLEPLHKIFSRIPFGYRPNFVYKVVPQYLDSGIRADFERLSALNSLEPSHNDTPYQDSTGDVRILERKPVGDEEKDEKRCAEEAQDSGAPPPHPQDSGGSLPCDPADTDLEVFLDPTNVLFS